MNGLVGLISYEGVTYPALLRTDQVALMISEPVTYEDQACRSTSEPYFCRAIIALRK
jgi:hypothetical protein